jgi:peptide/nickel transport system substrate-binding protein
MLRKGVVLAVALVLLLLPLAACGPQADTTTGEGGQGGTVIVGLQAEPTSLDSAQLSDYNSSKTRVQK